MCPNDNPAYVKPMLPRRKGYLFDNEVGSDVVFIVGAEKWRFPGHKTVLAEVNPVFKAMFFGHLATHDTTVHIEDVDERAFENLLRYLYDADVQLKVISTALSTLHAASRFLCSGLMRICIEYLDSQMNHTNVLEIYSNIYMLSDPIPLPNNSYENSSSQNFPLIPSKNSPPTPSAPPLESDDGTYGKQPLPATVENQQYQPEINGHMTDAILYCGALHYNCLQFIDQHASKVLMQEQVEDLEVEIIRLIAKRENLNLTSERILFDALNRWCNHECKRRQLELTAENQRTVLGQDTLFSVRYLLMSSSEFLEGPMKSGLLNHDEKAVIFSHIRHNASTPPKHLESVLFQMKNPRSRICGEANHLSNRTAPVVIRKDVFSTPEGSYRRSGRWGKKKDGKKIAKQKSKSCSPDRDSHKRSTGACVADYVFGFLSCVFD